MALAIPITTLAHLFVPSTYLIRSHLLVRSQLASSSPLPPTLSLNQLSAVASAGVFPFGSRSFRPDRPTRFRSLQIEYFAFGPGRANFRLASFFSNLRTARPHGFVPQNAPFVRLIPQNKRQSPRLGILVLPFSFVPP